MYLTREEEDYLAELSRADHQKVLKTRLSLDQNWRFGNPRGVGYSGKPGRMTASVLDFATLPEGTGGDDDSAAVLVNYVGMLLVNGSAPCRKTEPPILAEIERSRGKDAVQDAEKAAEPAHEKHIRTNGEEGCFAFKGGHPALQSHEGHRLVFRRRTLPTVKAALLAAGARYGRSLTREAKGGSSPPPSVPPGPALPGGTVHAAGRSRSTLTRGTSHSDKPIPGSSQDTAVGSEIVRDLSDLARDVQRLAEEADVNDSPDSELARARISSKVGVAQIDVLQDLLLEELINIKTALDAASGISGSGSAMIEALAEQLQLPAGWLRANGCGGGKGTCSAAAVKYAAKHRGSALRGAATHAHAEATAPGEIYRDTLGIVQHVAADEDGNIRKEGANGGHPVRC